MVLRFTDAHSIKPGNVFLIDGEPYKAISNDISKTGKHGASKCRIEAVGIFSDKKKIVAVPGSERFDVPNIDKRRAQILSVGEQTVSIMDMESYETIDIPFIEELKGQLAPEQQVEYWDVEGKRVVMRII